jgi:ornithine decarboxylase
MRGNLDWYQETGRYTMFPDIPQKHCSTVGCSNPVKPPIVDIHSTPRAALSINIKNHIARNVHLPLMVTDLGVVQRQYDRWVKSLPMIRPFYAVKCNPAVPVLQQLASAGAGFDCASQVEIRLALETGVEAKDIIFANPIKTFSDLEFARFRGVKRMTFDNLAELQKIHTRFPDAELVLRILTDDSGSRTRFGCKFGAHLVGSKMLLRLARDLNMSVVGVSFHIGSACMTPQSYELAIHQARLIANLNKSLGGAPFSLLDIGGGFPGSLAGNTEPDVPVFETYAQVIANSLAHHFPRKLFPNLTIISEPGRYFPMAACTLFTLVQGKRSVNETRSANPEFPDRVIYYVNDGVYGSFNNVMFDHAIPNPRPLEEFFASETQPIVPIKLSTTIFGPTCDSIDVLATDISMRELNVGDWLAFENMGAYTNAAASQFNGVPLPIAHFVRSLKS